MTRWLGAALATMILAFASAVPARADVAGLDAAADRADTAATAFLALAKGSDSSGTAPRASDPKVGPLLDAVLDTGLVSSSRLASLDDLKAVSRWAGASVRVGLVYVLAGTGLSDPSQITADPKLTAQISRNTVLFAPEMGRWLDASEVLQGGIIDAVTALAPTGPKNAQTEKGQEMIRNGAEQGIEGALTTLPTDGLDNAWRLERLKVLVVFAGKASKMLHPAQCDTIRTTIASVSPSLTDPAVQTGLKDVAAALKC